MTGSLSSSFSRVILWDFFALLDRRAEQAAEDALDGDLRGVQADGRVLRVGGAQLDLRAEAVEPLERGARALDERDDDLAVARLRPVLYQRDVAVADVLVDHRVARHPQGVDATGAHATQEEARDGDGLAVF